MFASIHKNLYRENIAKIIPNTTFYRWLNGGVPSIPPLAKACDALIIESSSINYVNKFHSVAKKLSTTKEPNKIIEILKVEKLLDEDLKLLKHYHLNRIWRIHSRIASTEDIQNEH